MMMNRIFSKIVMTGVMTGGLVLVPVSVWAQQQSESFRHGYGSHMMNWGGGGHGMFFGPIFMIVVLAIVIALTVLLVRWLGGSWHGTQAQHHAMSGPKALNILKERYARGEIDKEEFEERRSVLGD